MADLNSISPAALMRLIATPAAPAILDVRLDEDRASAPVCVPGARISPHQRVDAAAPANKAKKIVVICHKGLKLSHGAAALLRSQGRKAEVLQGGMSRWIDQKLPAIPISKIPDPGEGGLWVTRHRPKIDRLACPWLIRRFIDPEARFLYVPGSEVLAVADRFGATAFDVTGAPYAHQNGKCTFDSLLQEFELETDALLCMASVIQAADTNNHGDAPEAAGLLALSVGLSRAYPNDLEQLEAGMVLYDALYRWARDGQDETHAWPEHHS